MTLIAGPPRLKARRSLNAHAKLETNEAPSEMEEASSVSTCRDCYCGFFVRRQGWLAEAYCILMLMQSTRFRSRPLGRFSRKEQRAQLDAQHVARKGGH